MKYTIILILIFSLNSCSALMSKIYGINTIEKVDYGKIEQFYQEIDFLGIDTVKKYSLFNYYNSIGNNTLLDSLTKKDLRQPIQIWYYKDNKIILKRINCSVPGLGNLNWNYDGLFDVFPPISSKKITKKLEVEKILSQYLIQPEKEYTILIFWTRFLEKQSKGAIEQVLNNVKNNRNETQIILINLDKEFIYE